MDGHQPTTGTPNTITPQRLLPRTDHLTPSDICPDCGRAMRLHRVFMRTWREQSETQTH